LKYEHLPNESVRQYVYRILNIRIQLCELAPGTMLSENSLAAELGVSRTPVREALQDLAAQNFVEVLPQRGSRVTLLDIKRIEDGFFVRQAIEIAVAEKLCDYIRPDDYTRLKKETEYYLDLSQRGVLSKTEFLENGFHQGLFEACGKSEAFYHMRYFSAHSSRYQKLRSSDENYVDNFQTHLDILEAIHRGDKKEVREMMGRHIQKSFFDVDIVRKKYPQYFL